MTAMLAGHCSEFRQPAAIMKRRSRHILFLWPATAAAIARLLVCNTAAQERCQLTTIGTANVATVRDGRTLSLSDGRELRLAGIEVTDDSRVALQALVAGHPLRLERLGPERDRYYGRLAAFAFAGDARRVRATGHARARPRAGGDARRRQGLRRHAFERGNCGADGSPRALGRSKFRPFVGRKSGPATGRARPVRVGGRQGLVGTRERGHYICEFRAALDTGFHRDHSAARAKGVYRGRH